MSNWDLMMPGMGLTAIGVAGVTISYAGVAHTFIDGMHALTGLTMFIGLIFLAAGILDGGISTSNRAKATTLVILGISLSFGVAALTFNSVTSIPTFAGVMLIVAIPAIVIAYTAMKMPQYAKPIGMIFVIATGAAIAAYIGFGVYGPSQYLVPPPVEVEEEKPAAPALTAPVTTISILKGSSVQGSPDYDPDLAQVPAGNNIEWVNNDEIVHTATSSDGKSFDTSIIKPGENYVLDASKLQPGTYDYICIVHPYMTSTLVYGESGQRLTEDATVTDPNSIPPTEVPIEGVPVETPVEVPVETPVEEIPVEEAPIEEIPVETPIEEMPAGTSEETAIPATEVTVDMAVGTGSNTECGDQCFIPNVVKVSKGGKIIWTNSDSMIHTATASDQSFDTGFVSGGASSELTFENPGTYDYICQVHPWMKGQIIVE